MAKANYSTEVQTAGLFGNNNEVTVPPGAIAIGDNVIINRDNVYERRPGFDSCSAGLPAAKPLQLWSDHDYIYCHINDQLYYQSGDCNWTMIRGIIPTYYNPMVIWSNSSYVFVIDQYAIRRINRSNLYVSTWVGNILANGYLDAAGTDARFLDLIGVWGNSSDIYVTDQFRVRKISLSTSQVTTFAGGAINGSIDGIGVAARFGDEPKIWGDGTYIYVADRGNDSIRRIEISTANVITWAGMSGMPGNADGVGPAARFNLPTGITGDGTYLYVSDANGVRKIELTTASVTTLVAIPLSVAFYPHLTCDGTNLYSVPSANSYISSTNKNTGATSVFCGSPGLSGYIDAVGMAARFDISAGRAGGLFYDPSSGSIFVPDRLNYLIRSVSVPGASATTYSGVPFTQGTTDGYALIKIVAPSE